MRERFSAIDLAQDRQDPCKSRIDGRVRQPSRRECDVDSRPSPFATRELRLEPKPPGDGFRLRPVQEVEDRVMDRKRPRLFLRLTAVGGELLLRANRKAAEAPADFVQVAGEQRHGQHLGVVIGADIVA